VVGAIRPATEPSYQAYNADSALMPLRLRVLPAPSRSRKGGSKSTPAAAERSIDFDDGLGQIRIGRRADLELSLPFSPLSGVHARLLRASDSDQKTEHWVLEDLGSTNGTYVGGERLKPGIKRPLTAGERIKLAEIQLIFDGEVPGDERTQTFVHRQISDIFSPGPATESVPFLTAVAGINEGATTFRIEERDHVYMFGRTRRCDFRVKTVEVSREHASFVRRTDGIYVNDLGSVNGVLVNNTKVQEFKLFDGDLIQIGHVKLRLFDPSDPSPRGADASTASAASVGAARSEVRATPPHPHGVRDEDPPPPPARDEKSTTFRSELHPAIAGALNQEGVGYRRRPSVRIRLVETWESSSRFRYGIVIVAASLLGICAVIVGFSLAG
jgi:pSer/pThr/pTyr-binding forkhead associated (FHA) protein